MRVSSSIVPFSVQTRTGSDGSEGLLMLTAVLAMTLNWYVRSLSRPGTVYSSLGTFWLLVLLLSQASPGTLVYST